MKKEVLYRVKSGGGRELVLAAADSGQAKRRFCRAYGLSPGDPWTGMSNLSARKLTPKEAEEWEAQAGDRQALGIFLKGMMELCCKAQNERGSET